MVTLLSELRAMDCINTWICDTTEEANTKEFSWFLCFFMLDAAHKKFLEKGRKKKCVELNEIQGEMGVVINKSSRL